MLRTAGFARPQPALRVTRASTNVSVCARGPQGFHVEVSIGEGENDEAALRRFGRSTKAARIAYEVRRRRRFENRQDRKKRKIKERGLFKEGMPMAVEPEEWTEVRGVMDPSPFGDMFTDPNDVFGSTDFPEYPGVGADLGAGYGVYGDADYLY